MKVKSFRRFPFKFETSRTSRKSETKKTFKCHYCKKPGHYALDCYKKKADTKANDSVQVGNFVTKDANADDKAELALKSSNPTTMNDV